MSRLRSLGALALLGAATPVSLAATAVTAVVGVRGVSTSSTTNERDSTTSNWWSSLSRPPAAATTRPRTVLVSGGKMSKALQLCRAFHVAGHRVVLVETERYRLTGHRFSRAVDAFHVVPDSTDPAYADALVDVVQREGVDVYVPVCSPASSIGDADARAALEAAGCEVVHPGPDDVRRVDDKFTFFQAARDLGLPVPDTHRITDPQQVLDFDFTGRPRPYVLKSIAYDPVHRLDLTRLPRPTAAETEAFVRGLPISADSPWILQEFVEGTEYCTHGTVREGRLQVYVCCVSSAWQLTYEMVEKPAIRAWVETFVKAEGLTGQLSFDFIEDADGVAHAIECNPRTHSAITLLHRHPDLARAYLDDDVETVVPPLGGRPTYWLHHELWHALRHPATAPARARLIWRGRDAVLDAHDPLPFLALHHLHLPSLLLRALRHGTPWLRIDVNIGKLVQPAGD